MRDLFQQMIIDGAKENTIKRYKFSLKAFQKYVSNNLESLSDAEIYNGLQLLMQSSYSKRTKEDIKMAVKRYYSFYGRKLNINYSRQINDIIFRIF